MRAACPTGSYFGEERELLVEVDCPADFLGFWMGKELEKDWEAEAASLLCLKDFQIRKDDNGVYVLSPMGAS